MLSSFQSYRTIFQQALLARAAYGDLRGITFSDVDAVVAALSSESNRFLPPAAARYVAGRFGVVHHQPNELISGYSGTLFRLRDVAEGDTSGGFTFE